MKKRIQPEPDCASIQNPGTRCLIGHRGQAFLFFNCNESLKFPLTVKPNYNSQFPIFQSFLAFCSKLFPVIPKLFDCCVLEGRKVFLFIHWKINRKNVIHRSLLFRALVIIISNKATIITTTIRTVIISLITIIIARYYFQFYSGSMLSTNLSSSSSSFLLLFSVCLMWLNDAVCHCTHSIQSFSTSNLTETIHIGNIPGPLSLFIDNFHFFFGILCQSFDRHHTIQFFNARFSKPIQYLLSSSSPPSSSNLIRNKISKKKFSRKISPSSSPSSSVFHRIEFRLFFTYFPLSSLLKFKNFISSLLFFSIFPEN